MEPMNYAVPTDGGLGYQAANNLVAPRFGGGGRQSDRLRAGAAPPKSGKAAKPKAPYRDGRKSPTLADTTHACSQRAVPCWDFMVLADQRNYPTSLRRNIPPSPTSPTPNILKVPGSGTASGVLPTLMCPIP